jgi:hypothetical protein
MAKVHEVLVRDVEGNWYRADKEALGKVDPEEALAALSTERNLKREKISEIFRTMDPMDKAILRDMVLGSMGAASLPPWVHFTPIPDMPVPRFRDFFDSPPEGPSVDPPHVDPPGIGPWWQWRMHPYYMRAPRFRDFFDSPPEGPSVDPPHVDPPGIGPWWQWWTSPYGRGMPYGDWRMGSQMARQRYRYW